MDLDPKPLPPYHIDLTTSPAPEVSQVLRAGLGAANDWVPPGHSLYFLKKELEPLQDNLK